MTTEFSRRTKLSEGYDAIDLVFRGKAPGFKSMPTIAGERISKAINPIRERLKTDNELLNTAQDTHPTGDYLACIAPEAFHSHQPASSSNQQIPKPC